MSQTTLRVSLNHFMRHLYLGMILARVGMTDVFQAGLFSCSKL